jgi:hypothetical protein
VKFESCDVDVVSDDRYKACPFGRIETRKELPDRRGPSEDRRGWPPRLRGRDHVDPDPENNDPDVDVMEESAEL